MSQSSLRFIVLPSLVYPFFELEIEQDEVRKALLIKQETEWMNEWMNEWFCSLFLIVIPSILE